MALHKKSNNHRKAAAVALAVLGVTGLTLASAAQLNLSTPASVQAGVASVAADCQPTAKTIDVKFAEPTLVGDKYSSSKITFSNIDNACATKKFKVSLIDGSGAVTETPGTIGASGSTSISVDVADHNAVDKIALTIY